MTPKSFSIDGFVKADSTLVLKTVGVVQGEDGFKPAGQYETVAELINLHGKYGAFLMNPLPEEERDSKDTFYISATNPENRGMRAPVATLRVKRAGSQESEHVCGLFLRTYDDGNVGLIGTDKDNARRYGVFANQAKQAEKIAVNQN